MKTTTSFPAGKFIVVDGFGLENDPAYSDFQQPWDR
jgi:hypothetical protein